MNVKTSANNRSLTQNGANKIFNHIGIHLYRDPLGFWYSQGHLCREAPTLTALCQVLLEDLISIKEQSEKDQKTLKVFDSKPQTTDDKVYGKIWC
jgi:hypothetical protein